MPTRVLLCNGLQIQHSGSDTRPYVIVVDGFQRRQTAHFRARRKFRASLRLNRRQPCTKRRSDGVATEKHSRRGILLAKTRTWIISQENARITLALVRFSMATDSDINRTAEDTHAKFTSA